MTTRGGPQKQKASRERIEVRLVMVSLIKKRLRLGQEVLADVGCIINITVDDVRACPTNFFAPIEVKSADLDPPGWHSTDRIFYRDWIDLSDERPAWGRGPKMLRPKRKKSLTRPKM